MRFGADDLEQSGARVRPICDRARKTIDACTVARREHGVPSPQRSTARLESLSGETLVNVGAMVKTILVCGFGPGISTAVAEKFGAEGFQVALVARNRARLDAGTRALAAKGVKAAAFVSDLGDASAAPALVERVRAALGPVSVIHWNAYGSSAGDLLTAEAGAIRGALDIAVTSLVAVVQAALADLKKAERPAVLVTNGGFGRIDPNMDAIGVQYGAMGLSVANAAKDKLVGLLAKRLESDGIYVGQVTQPRTRRCRARDQPGDSLAQNARARPRAAPVRLLLIRGVARRFNGNRDGIVRPSRRRVGDDRSSEPVTSTASPRCIARPGRRWRLLHSSDVLTGGCSLARIGVDNVAGSSRAASTNGATRACPSRDPAPSHLTISRS